jgi:hypothetical protein
VDSLTALSAQRDPLRPFEADEAHLYVDWQDQLDTADDVKVRLANSIARSSVPVTRPFTGHRGAGKTTDRRQLVSDLTGLQGSASRSPRRSSVTPWVACATSSRDGSPATRRTWAWTR